jgi:hypothetical protein
MRSLAFALSILVAASCGPAPSDPRLEVVLPGKADGYYSDVAAEFRVEGSAPLALSPAELADPARRNRAIERRLTAIALYLTAYVSDKIAGIDRNGDGAIGREETLFRNVGYGGFHAMVRNRSAEALGLEVSPSGGVTLRFGLFIAGPTWLLSAIPGERDPRSGALVFPLFLPSGASVAPGEASSAPVRSFDPARHAGPLDRLLLTARRAPAAGNAYPRYADFVADGRFDITVFFGHDPHVARHDLAEARATFDALVALGFRAPVRRFEDLRAQSGPLVRKARARGRPIDIEVRLYHADLFQGARDAQRELARREIVARDVFVYAGHAGPYFGLFLGPNGTAHLSAADLGRLPFSPARQQLFVAQGCQTYSQYADALFASPRKSEQDLDVITTVSFAYGQGTIELLAGLTFLDAEGNHRPLDYGGLLGAMNANPVNREQAVLYGALGVDDNPRLHPYAAPGRIGARCETNADCGDPNGNVCAWHPALGARCGAVALAESACPSETRLHAIARGRSIVALACMR